MKPIISSIAFHADGISFNFAQQGDLKSNGLLLNHTLLIPHLEEFADLIDEFIDHAGRVVTSGLAAHKGAEDFPEFGEAVSWEHTHNPDEDDESSPYDNPTERPGVQY